MFIFDAFAFLAIILYCFSVNRADVIDVGRSASFASVYNITMPVTPIPTKYTLSIVAVNGSPDAVSSNNDASIEVKK